jgi:hypothetical protein
MSRGRSLVTPHAHSADWVVTVDRIVPTALDAWLAVRASGSRVEPSRTNRRWRRAVVRCIWRGVSDRLLGVNGAVPEALGRVEHGHTRQPASSHGQDTGDGLGGKGKEIIGESGAVLSALERLIHHHREDDRQGELATVFQGSVS